MQFGFGNIFGGKTETPEEVISRSIEPRAAHLPFGFGILYMLFLHM
jgi:hypothetical protein